MEFLYLVMEDMFSYEGLFVVDLGTPGLTRLVGKNGSGKSSVFNTMCQVLFDQNPTEEGKDRVTNDVLNRGGWGGVGFIDDVGNVYHVGYYRLHKKFGTGHRLYIRKGEKWDDISGNDVHDTKSRIQQCLKYKYQNFVASVYLSQNQITHKFLVGTSGDRDVVFTDLMGLEFYDGASGIAKNMVKELKEEIGILQAKHKTYQDVLDSLYKDETIEQSLNDLKYDLKSFEDEFGKLEKIAVNKWKYNEVMGLIQTTEKDRVDCERRWAESGGRLNSQRILSENLKMQLIPIEDEIRTLVYDEKEMESTNDQIDDMMEINHEYRSSIRGEERVIEINKEQIDKKATGTKCYACGQVITDETLEKHIEDMEQRILVCDKRRKGWMVSIAKNEKQIKDLDVLRQAIQAVKSRREELMKEMSETTSNLDVANSRVVDIGSEAERESERLKGIDLKIAEYKTELSKIGEVSEFDEVRYEDLKDLVSARKAQIQLWESREKQKEEIQLNQSNIDLSVKKCMENMSLYQWWENGYKILKHYKLEEAAGILNDSCGKTLNTLHGGMQLEFDIESDYKSKKGKKRKFEIFVSSGKKKKVPIKLYSGGEKVLLSCAVTSGLWEVGERCGKSSSNLLMLDEPAGALDEEHREKMALWLEELKSKAKTILFATHVDLGAELFDNELQVVKENDLSHITQDIGFREAVMELIPEEL